VNEEKTPQRESTPLEHLMFKGHLQITIRVVAITIATLAIWGGGGYLLDKALATFPLFMIIGLVVAFPLAQLLIYKTFRKVTNAVTKKQ